MTARQLLILILHFPAGVQRRQSRMWEPGPAERPLHDCRAEGFLRGLRELQSTGTLCDVILKGCEESAVGIPCHRNVLSVHSAYFRTVFTQDWKDSSQPIFQLRNIDSRTLNELVKYAYTLDLSLNADNAASILIAAQFLQMEPVVRLCWNYVEQHMRLCNCLTVYALASNHHNPPLAATAVSLIRRHFVRLSQDKQFLEMDSQQLTAVIVSDDVDVGSEDQVLHTVLRWLDHDRPGRLAHVLAVLKGVRAALLSAQCRFAYSQVLGSVATLMPSCLVDEMPTRDMQNSTPRHSIGAQEVILCVGGDGVDGKVVATVDVFCPSTATVWRLQDLPTRVELCTAVLADPGWMIISTRRGLKTIQRDVRYTDLSGTWHSIAPMQTLRHAEGLAALDGRVYAVGGYGLYSAEMLASVEVYDPSVDSWSAAAPLPVGLAYPALVACGGRLYAFGGDSTENYGHHGGRAAIARATSSAFAYEPAVDTWSRLADMPTARSVCVASVAASGLIYVLGGHLHSHGRADVDAYNCVTNQWVRKRRFAEAAKIPRLRLPGREVVRSRWTRE
ncbi:kelch-like protein 18 [Paramacrobiotus metropolitanus]|uniref:kelch-like protein 18 n=1 Tax=Paramacrobiotus metropolitanus TaxID=2943436 RepID=UPI002445B913|nr:kelch-like protein 18 [Paramacrobiotus metropolitanus]